MKRLSILSSVVIVILLSISSCNKKGNTVNTSNEIDYVDLGLSVMWATCNIGASVPEEVGNYYAWGETENKRKYTWSTYKYCNRSSDKLTKYCYNKAWSNDKVDNKGFLDLSDDVANIKYGGTWHIPTIEELEELHECCTWSWTTKNGVFGYKITSNISGFTDRSIFIPVTGYYDIGGLEQSIFGGFYWSNSLSVGGGKNASSMYFSSELIDWYHDTSRNCGLPIRPVCTAERTVDILSDDSQNNNNDITVEETVEEYADNSMGIANNHEWVDMGLSVMWATCNVGANTPIEYGGYYAWGEIETKVEYTEDNYKWFNKSKKTRLGDYTLIKYNASDYYGVVDNKLRLDAEDDVATVEWGDGWRMPTYSEWNELRSKCIWTWIEKNGVLGYEVKSKVNENVIFLPAAGADNSNNAGITGHYWCSTKPSDGLWANSIDFDSKNKRIDYYTGFVVNGRSIRPVCSIDQKKIISDDDKEISDKSNMENGHEYVDLGLSVKWASNNVGATKPYENGDYYAWGETIVKEICSFANYKHKISGDYYTNIIYSKYNTNSSHGYIDGLCKLESSDDIAHVKWGGNWRMPTKAEFGELYSNCDWNKYSINGVKGYKITSRIKGYTNNSIFLPLTGSLSDSIREVGQSGYYWSSTLDDSDPNFACAQIIDQKYVSSEGSGSRYCGFSIRPVLP